MQRDKKMAIKYITDKLEHKSFLSYIEIAEITGFHPKYILRLKKQLLEGKVSLEHGNKNRKPINSLSEEEIQKIISLYKKSHVSIRKFCKFYSKRSYSCIYNVLKNHGCLDNND